MSVVERDSEELAEGVTKALESLGENADEDVDAESVDGPNGDFIIGTIK